MIEKTINNINNALYSYILIALLVGAGIFFTIRTKFVQFRLLKEQIKSVTEKPKDKNGVSSFEALMVSTASRVGTGNIIGVSTAICLGGYGSVFWMWIIAIIGSASAFVESTLAQIYKRRGNDVSYGGPAYYIETALGSRGIAVIFSVLLIITYGVGFNMLASFNLQSSFSSYSFYNKETSPWIIGFILAAIVLYCLIGGGKRIVTITGFLVPFMGVAYIFVALITVVINISRIDDVLLKIFNDAFDFEAIFGGFSGSCLMYGIKRGLFSNEAGVGSAPNASASAQVSHPARQGLVQVLSVFIDTILVCSATAFMCLCSGVEATTELAGAQYVQLSLKSSLGIFGPVFITAAMILFAFTTLLGNLYYVDKALIHLRGKEPGKRFMTISYVVFSFLIFIGSGLSADLLWNIADISMGAMTLTNIPVIIILSPYAIKALKDYEYKLKNHKELSFKAKDIDLPYKTDYWK
ncbi:MAG: alanine:cation symporter family protein [Clostridia bacterium]|nr:alanine:cation symporter family protein [Clostridia bacterium]